MTPSIHEQILTALDAATLENGYPHDYDRSPQEQVEEINDWSGLIGYDPKNALHRAVAVTAVENWRRANPRPVS